MHLQPTVLVLKNSICLDYFFFSLEIKNFFMEISLKQLQKQKVGLDLWILNLNFEFEEKDLEFWNFWYEFIKDSNDIFYFFLKTTKKEPSK